MQLRQQCLGQYGANGATAPPGPPGTTCIIWTNPTRYSGGEGGGAVAGCLVKPAAIATSQRFVVVLVAFRRGHYLQAQVYRVTVRCLTL